MAKKSENIDRARLLEAILQLKDTKITIAVLSDLTGYNNKKVMKFLKSIASNGWFSDTQPKQLTAEGFTACQSEYQALVKKLVNQYYVKLGVPKRYRGIKCTDAPLVAHLLDMQSQAQLICPTDFGRKANLSPGTAHDFLHVLVKLQYMNCEIIKIGKKRIYTFTDSGRQACYELVANVVSTFE